MTSRRTALSCRHCGAPGRLYLGGRLCPRHAPGGPDGEVMRPFPQVNATIVPCGDAQNGPGLSVATAARSLTIDDQEGVENG